MTISDRNDLKKVLRQGDLEQIAINTGVKYQTVHAWFKDKTNNPFIEEAAKSISEYRLRQIENIKQKFSTTDDV